MRNPAAFWRAFWATVLGVNIRIKIMGIVAFSILVSAFTLIVYERIDDMTAFRQLLHERGVSIGTGLAAQGRDLILTDNQFALYSLVKDTLNSDQDIAYIFLLDVSGNVLIHTFEDGFPTDLLGKNEVPPGETYRMQRLQTGKDMIQDIAVPVLGGKAGVVHLGMSEASIKNTVSEHIQNILRGAGLVLLLGLVVAYAMSSILTKPIFRLVQVAQKAGKGNFIQWDIPIWAKDEIGKLGEALNDMSNELRHKEEMRQQLLAQVITAQEEERKRIARELHDETSQALTSLMLGLKFMTDSADSEVIKEKITELRTLTAQTLDNVHQLSTQLRPTLLDDLGLSAAVQKYAQEYSTKTGIKVDCQVDIDSDKHFSSESKVTVYRIIQEALTNIARHAEANNVSVILRNRGSNLVAIVEDDGRGFDVSSAISKGKHNLGLFGMYERASLVGGKLTVESQEGEGTTIFLEVPLNGMETIKYEENQGYFSG